MPKRTAWMFCASGAIALALGIAWFGRQPSPTVRFWDGTTSVIKVSYGTNHVFVAEPFWKQALRKVLPDTIEKRLGPEKRFARSTPHNSLALFVDPVPVHSVGARILFPDGSSGRAVFHSRSYGPILVFSSYPREQQELLVRFSDLGRQAVDVKIPNPRPIGRASWTASKSFQTNYVRGTEIVLRPKEFWDEWRMGVSLRARSEFPGGVGWTRWRTTLFDQCGNWYAGDYNKLAAIPGSKLETQFRVVAEGQEYISAGFVTTPTNYQHFALTLHPRATNWGVQFLALVGAGAYEVSRQGAIQTRKPNSLNSSFVTWNRGSCTVQCTQPALLSIANQPVWGFRLRERLLPDKRGRVFARQNVSSATLHLSVNEMLRGPIISSAPAGHHHQSRSRTHHPMAARRVLHREALTESGKPSEVPFNINA